jgi:hypothetical protein
MLRLAMHGTKIKLSLFFEIFQIFVFYLNVSFGYVKQWENVKEAVILSLTCFFTYFNLEQTRSKFICNDFQFYSHPTSLAHVGILESLETP